MKKNKYKKIINILTIILIILIVITLCISISIKKKNKNDVKETIIGKWTTDEVTVYQFNKDNTGMLIVPLSEYKFTYKIKDNKLSIDFQNEKSEDSEYTYSLEKNKLILKGQNGTFTFKRKK